MLVFQAILSTCRVYSFVSISVNLSLSLSLASIRMFSILFAPTIYIPHISALTYSQIHAASALTRLPHVFRRRHCRQHGCHRCIGCCRPRTARVAQSSHLVLFCRTKHECRESVARGASAIIVVVIVVFHHCTVAAILIGQRIGRAVLCQHTQAEHTATAAAATAYSGHRCRRYILTDRMALTHSPLVVVIVIIVIVFCSCDRRLIEWHTRIAEYAKHALSGAAAAVCAQHDAGHFETLVFFAQRWQQWKW
jgi:hypothetical protein